MLQEVETLTWENSPVKILCFYINATSYLQTIRIANMVEDSLNRVVFPGQRILFEALPEAFIEISTGNPTAPTITEKIKCAFIQVDEGLNIFLPTVSSHPAEKDSQFLACGW